MPQADGGELDYFCSFRTIRTAKTRWAFNVIEVPRDCFSNSRLIEGPTIVQSCLTGRGVNYDINTAFKLRPNVGATALIDDAATCGPLHRISFPKGENSSEKYRAGVR